MDVPTHSAAALNASPSPRAPPATNSPRVPAAAIPIDSPDSSAEPPAGASSSPPDPRPATPHTVTRSVTL